jgi:UDP-glucuronate 4-epimerase
MALFKFTRAILEDRPIQVYNRGHHSRDFTYIDDIVEGIVRVIDRPPVPDETWRSDAPDAATSSAPWRLYNIGNNRSVKLMQYIAVLENALGKCAEKEMLPMQPGDVANSLADVTDLVRDFDYHPSTTIEDGIQRFVEWYLDYFRG